MSVVRYIVLAIFLALAAIVPAGCGDGRPAKPNVDLKKIAENIPQSSDIDVSIKPNVAYAIRNEYVVLPTNANVEILDGWSAKFSLAPNKVDDPTKIDWYLGEDNQFTGSEWNPTFNQPGYGKIKAAGKKNGNLVSFSRDITVGKVESKSFELTPGGPYKKSARYPNWVVSPSQQKPPGTVPITMNGLVKIKDGTPDLKAFEWGFIQSVEDNGGPKYIRQQPEVAITPGFDKTTFECPSFVYFPACPANTNDAPRGSLLFAGHASLALGSPAPATGPNAYYDDPKIDAGAVENTFDHRGDKVRLRYAITEREKSTQKYMVWQVVIHNQTKQCAPLKQRGWTADWDTAQDGPFPVAVTQEVTLLTTPPLSSTSSDDYKKLVFGWRPKYHNCLRGYL